jgi:Rieske Fe-S protein
VSQQQQEERSAAPDGRPASEQPAWRREFPVDTVEDQYLCRRDFTLYMGLISLAFVVGQFWIALRAWIRGGEAAPGAKTIVPLEQVPVGGVVPFTYPNENDACLLLRPDEKTLLAYSQHCTHLSCAVVPDMEHGQLHCPCHHGVFDLATGHPLAGPPRRPLSRISLEVIDGEVRATGVEVRAK